MSMIDMFGILLELIIIGFSILGVIETIVYIRRNPKYSFTWIKILSAIVLAFIIPAYAYLLVRFFFPMSLSDYYWYSTVVIRILVAGLVVVLALSAKIRNIHRR
jgi:hypothetical protein